MSLLKRLGGAPQPNEPSTPPSAPTPPPAEPARSTTPTEPPRPATPASQPPVQSGFGTAASAPPAASGVITSDAGGATDQRILELSLWIVDRVQGSMGNQTELKRTAESERMLQDRFTNYYRQNGINLSDAQVKKLYEMVTDELFGFGQSSRCCATMLYLK